MRRSFRQHRLRAAEDLFLKVMLLVVVLIAISVVIVNRLDGGSPKTQVEGAQANRVQPSPIVVPSSLVIGTTTTTVAPAPPTPDLRGLAAFLAAQAKARQDAAAATAAAAPA